MKKKLFTLFLTLAMLTPTLAACGNNIPDETEADTAGNPAVETSDSSGGKSSAAVDLVTDGVSEFVIVRGENAAEYEITAASELQSYMKQITGAELPIVTDATAAAEKEIVIGLTNRETEGQFDRAELEDDGFIIKTEGGKLWLIGGEKTGTLYAVYELLEAYLGCRFYTPEFEKIPETKNITLEIAEDKQVPTINFRYIYWESVVYSTNTLFAEKMRTYGPSWTSGGACHTLPYLAEKGDGHSGDPCLTNPTVYETVLKNVRAQLAAAPDADFISVSQSDNSWYCPCEACAAVVAEHGVSGYYLQFTNRIAEEIADEYPDVLIHMFAYLNTVEPPISDIKAADNVMVQYCFMHNCYSHPFSQCTVTDEGGYLDSKSHVEGWAAICKNLCFWDYNVNMANYSLGDPNWDALWQNIQFYAENNARYVFAQGFHHSHGNKEFGNMGDLKVYLFSKLLWNPTMGEEKYYALMDEFLADYYGPGWENIRAYIDYVEKVTDTSHFGWSTSPDEHLQFTTDDSNAKREIPELSADTLRNYKDVDWTQYYQYFKSVSYNDVVEKGIAWFEAARQACETEEQLLRVNRTALQAEILNVYLIEAINLRCAFPALGKIFDGNLKARVADGSMTQEEANALKAAFNADIKLPLKEAADTAKTEFAQKAMECGLTYLRDGSTVQGFLDGEEGFWQ